MQKFFTIRFVILIGLISIPSLAFAELNEASAVAGITSFSNIVNTFNSTIIKSLATLFLSLGILAFFYGIVEYIWGKRQGDSTKVKTGNEFMVWGLVALFVMFSVYGIIKLTQSLLFNNQDVTTIRIPEVNFNSGGGATTGGRTGTGGVTNECSGKPNGTVCAGGMGSCQNSSCMAP